MASIYTLLMLVAIVVYLIVGYRLAKLAAADSPDRIGSSYTLPTQLFDCAHLH